MIDKEAIRAAAEAATPGPWRPEIGDDYADVTLQDGQPLADCHYIDKRCFDTARYIALMDPDTTVALLDELEGAEARWRVNMAEQSIEELPSFCEHREWSARKHGDACPECQAPMSMEANHGQEVEG